MHGVHEVVGSSPTTPTNWTIAYKNLLLVYHDIAGGQTGVKKPVRCRPDFLFLPNIGVFWLGEDLSNLLD